MWYSTTGTLNFQKRQAFFSPKINKRPGYDSISFNAIKNCFDSLHKSLLHMFNRSLKEWIFADDSNIARVPLLLKMEIMIIL